MTWFALHLRSSSPFLARPPSSALCEFDRGPDYFYVWLPPLYRSVNALSALLLVAEDGIQPWVA